MADVLIDTDIFIDHLRGAAPLRPGRNRVHYSVITRAELFAGTTDGEVFFSADEGQSWATIAQGIPPVSKAGHYRGLRPDLVAAR